MFNTWLSKWFLVSLLLLGLSQCTTLHQIEQTTETALLTHQVLVREVVRLGTQELLAFHPDVAPGIILWANRVAVTITLKGKICFDLCWD